MNPVEKRFLVDSGEWLREVRDEDSNFLKIVVNEDLRGNA
jgi:hypothetical protein